MSQTLSNRQRWIAIMTFGTANGIIYLLPYIQYPYYDSMKEAFHFNNTEMGSLISIFGLVNAFLYTISGLILDKYAKDKIFVILAMVITGIGGFVLATYPSFYVSLAVMSLFGFTTTFLFWVAYLNGKRRLGTENDMGKVFGLSESFSMISAMLASASGFYIFHQMDGNFSAVIIYYSLLHFLAAIICFFLIPNNIANINPTGEKIQRNQVKVIEGLCYLIKRPDIWYISMILFCSYSIAMTVARISPYVTTVFSVSVSLATAIGIVNQYVVSIAGPSVGGMVADKMTSSAKFIKYCFLYLAGAALLLIMLPGNSKFLAVAVILGWSIKLIQTCQKGAYWVPLSETKLPEIYSGTAIGLVSFLGFLPEAFIHTFWGLILDAFPDDTTTGYKTIFFGIVVFSLLGFVFCQLFLRDLKRRGLL